MSAQNNGGPAFPRSPHSGEESDDGMTLRDYFAAKAMQGLIAATGDSDGVVTYDSKTVAANAYEMADAMLKAREK